MLHKLRQARFKLQITQFELAEQIKKIYSGSFYQNYVSNIELFNVTPRELTKKKIINALNEVASKKKIKVVYDIDLFDN